MIPVVKTKTTVYKRWYTDRNRWLIPSSNDDKPYMYEDKPHMHDDKPYMYDDMTSRNDDMTDRNDDMTEYVRLINHICTKITHTCMMINHTCTRGRSGKNPGHVWWGGWVSGAWDFGIFSYLFWDFFWRKITTFWTISTIFLHFCIKLCTFLLKLDANSTSGSGTSRKVGQSLVEVTFQTS